MSSAQGRWLVGGPTAHSHQPPTGRQDAAQRAASQCKKGPRIKLVPALAVAHLAASYSDLNAPSKSARCPFDRTYFYCRAVSIRRAPMQIPWRQRRPPTGVSRGPGRATGQARRATGALGLDMLEQSTKRFFGNSSGAMPSNQSAS
jgi:hypothetical protein